MRELHRKKMIIKKSEAVSRFEFAMSNVFENALNCQENHDSGAHHGQNSVAVKGYFPTNENCKTYDLK